MAHNSFADNLKDAAWEQIEAKITEWVASSDINVLDDEGVIGTIALALATVPQVVTSFTARTIGERIEKSHIGTPAFRKTIATFINGTVDGIEELRRKKELTTDKAREELIRRWREHKAKKADLAFTKSTPPAAPPAAPPDVLMVSGSYSEKEQDMLYALFGILRRELKPGVDIVPEVEGDAGLTIVGLFEAVNKAKDATKANIPSSTLAKTALTEYRNWQMRRTPETQGVTEEVAERETDLRARRLVQLAMPFVEYLALGYVSRRPTETGLVNKVNDFLDQVGNFAGLPKGGRNEKLKLAAEKARAVGVAVTNVTTFAAAWAGVMLLLAIFFPVVTFEATMVSFLVLLVGTVYGGFTLTSTVKRQQGDEETRPAVIGRVAILITSGAIGILGMAYGNFIAMLVDTEPVPAFLAGYEKVVALQPFHLTATVLCMVFLIIWNHVALAFLQETSSGVSHLKDQIAKLFGSKEQAGAFAEAVKKNLFFTKVGNTVLSAVAAIVFAVIVSWLLGAGPMLRGLFVFVASVLAVLRSNLWAAAVRKYPGLAKRHEEISKEDGDKAAKAVYVVPVILIVVIATLALLGPDRVQSLKDRTLHVTDKAASAFDEATGYTPVASPKSAPSPATASTSSSPATSTTCANLAPASRTVLCDKYQKCCP